MFKLYAFCLGLIFLNYKDVGLLEIFCYVKLLKTFNFCVFEKKIIKSFTVRRCVLQFYIFLQSLCLSKSCKCFIIYKFTVYMKREDRIFPVITFYFRCVEPCDFV